MTSAKPRRTETNGVSTVAPAFSESHLPLPIRAITIGNFDGVHLGHRALICVARQLAGPEGEV
ncbi:MAG: hypothetical protein H7210_05340, partial [Pyrinomonadaceae bacterium]|nr:hypothetical protein [Phycisphaerales bacterium]